MALPKLLRSSPRGFVTGEQVLNVGGVKLFPLDGPEVAGPTLSVATIDMGGPIFVMEDEPEFEAGVGESDADVALSSFVDRLGEVGVLVDIEDAPDFVEVDLRRTRFRRSRPLGPCVASERWPFGIRGLAERG